MKNAYIFYLRNDDGNIYGAQIVDADGRGHTLTTNRRREGLWCGDQQIIGTCDFDLRCAESTARKKLREYAIFSQYNFTERGYGEEVPLVASRKKLF